MGPAEARNLALPHISPEIHHQFKIKEEDTKWPEFCERMDAYWHDLASKMELAGRGAGRECQRKKECQGHQQYMNRQEEEDHHRFQKEMLGGKPIQWAGQMI